MDLGKASNLATSLMNQHNLTNWCFIFDNSVRRFGCCQHGRKVISLSKKLTLLNDEARIKNTLLHEIAHALVGVGHGHDSVWKAKALSIGCDGNRCYSTKEVETPESKYIATCKKCGHIHKKHRQPKGKTSCGICSNKFDANNLLEYKINHQ